MTILEYVKDKEMTIAGLARKLGYTRRYISAIAHGRMKASQTVIDKIIVFTQGAVTF